MVRRRKHQRAPRSGEAIRAERTRNIATQKPFAATAKRRVESGVVEVCGKCRQLGHHVIECKRLEVCRRCERPGHRAVHCSVPSSMLNTPQAYENEQLQMKGKKRKAERDMGEGQSLGNEQKEEQFPRRKAEPMKKESNKVSTAIDEGMVQEIQQLKSYTMATVTKGYAGSVPSRRVKEEVAALVGRENPHTLSVGGTGQKGGEPRRNEFQDLFHPISPMHEGRKLNGDG
ncbi:hypothetical protein J5N97_018360 [Dioscorea zingiberensis]|uniref:CCHC-type domain-containing protein n=1 Tax=Dioscorea zingiberensis TaxID=325984 RepID=A0A9D5HH66_9LILI|nr:hypothetical protein J5N97_018360 [Dioscorea zingiberensis]